MRIRTSADARVRTRVPMPMILVVVWAIPAALAVFETYAFSRLAGRPISLISIIVREGTTWTIYALLAPIIYRLANRFPLRPPSLAANIARHFCGAVILGVIAAAIGSFAMHQTLTSADAPQLRDMSQARLLLQWFLGDLPNTILAYFAIVGVAHAVRYFLEAQQRREDALKLEGQLADARLAALQGRLHPHFLYNTLNAITVLVRDGDIFRSTRMLELLSAMLRRVLDGSLPQIVSLETELALLRQYLEIEEVRFSDRLTIAIDVEEQALDAGVPALVTQPLAENVIRHAVAHTSRPVTLTISARILSGDGARTLELSVADNGPGLTGGWERRSIEHTGISATTMRLTTLYGPEASLVVRGGPDGGAMSIVRVPYARVEATQLQSTTQILADDTTDDAPMALAT